MANILPVITLYQPWATWVIMGLKDIETRTHSKFACLKGKEILIHAGLKLDRRDAPNTYSRKGMNAVPYNTWETIPKGAILGSAYVQGVGWLPQIEQYSYMALIDCETERRFGLFLSDVKMFENPILEKGEVGIWYFDLDTMQKVKKPKIQSQQLSITH